MNTNPDTASLDKTQPLFIPPVRDESPTRPPESANVDSANQQSIIPQTDGAQGESVHTLEIAPDSTVSAANPDAPSVKNELGKSVANAAPPPDVPVLNTEADEDIPWALDTWREYDPEQPDNLSPHTATSFELSYQLIMLALGLVVVIGSFLLQVAPDQDRVHLSGWSAYPLPPSCMSRSLLQMDCPGCGLTRSCIYFAQGRWADSLARHRLGWIFYLYFALQLPYRALTLWYRRSFLPSEIHFWFLRLITVALLLNWVYNRWQE